MEHRAVLQLIDSNQRDLEEFGDLAFEMRDRQGVPGPKLRIALLNEQQATLVMTYQRNTEPAQSPFDSIRRTRPDGSEYWSARELMPLLGYDRWENFEQSIHRAMAAARNSGANVEDLFRGVTEKGNGRPREDFHLARFACYLVAMNGDPRKPEVAAAQAYFAKYRVRVRAT